MAFRRICRALAVPMALAMFLSVGPLPAARAAMVSTDQVIAQDQAAQDRERVMAFLAREDVRREMEAMGVDPAEAAARAEALSEAEIARIATRLDQVPAGQSAVGAVIGAAVLIFIILLITDLLCLTSVFPFTHCAARK